MTIISGTPFDRFFDICLFAVSFMLSERLMFYLQRHTLMKLACGDTEQHKEKEIKSSQAQRVHAERP